MMEISDIPKYTTSPLVIFAKFLELISREELGSMLFIEPPSSLFEKHSSWYASYGDTQLFIDNDMNKIQNNKDRASIFNLKQIDYSHINNKSNANI